MGYDALGRRAWLEHAGTLQRFVYDRELRMVLDASGGLQTWLSTDERGRLLAEHDAVSGTTREALVDHLGTVQGWVGAEGAVEWQDTDSFGAGAVSGALEPHALTWHHRDPTGLVYARARYYDPETGRFLSEDPELLEPRYGYAGGDPVNLWDPTGRYVAGDYGKVTSTTGTATTAGARATGKAIKCILEAEIAALAIVTSGAVPVIVGCGALPLPPPPETLPLPEPEPDPPPDTDTDPDEETWDDQDGNCATRLTDDKRNTPCHDKCVDQFAPNANVGWDYYVEASPAWHKNFDAIDPLGALWELKTDRWSGYTDWLQGRTLAAHALTALNDYALAAECGYPYRFAVSDRDLEAELEAVLPPVIPVDFFDCRGPTGPIECR